MSKDKVATFNSIIHVAKKEFLENGYEKASIRNIAKKVGIVPSALYRHFKDKETLFSYFVEAALKGYDDLCEYDMSEVNKMLNNKEIDLIWLFSEEQFISRVKYIYKYYDAFKMLLTCSAGTKYSNFQHEMVTKDVDSTLAIWRKLKESDVSVREIDEQDFHIITSGLFSAVFEFIIHGYSEDEALKRSENLSIFFNNGMKSVIGV